MQNSTEQFFRDHRSFLLNVAYRMLGSVTDAEDIVQESWLKWQKQLERGVNIDNAQGYLTKIVTNLSVDLLRKRQVERGSYTGPWLPEPLVEEVIDDNSSQHKMQSLQSLSIAFMFILERLSPKERAVFILNEALDYQHQEIAEILDISAAASRQLLSRARQKTKSKVARHQVDLGKHKLLLGSFMQAIWNGDTKEIREVLAADAVAYTDGGGVVSAALVPLQGWERIVQVFLHLAKKYSQQQVQTQWLAVNGGWGAVFLLDKKVISLVQIVTTDTQIEEIYVVRNPDKLNGVNRNMAVD